MSFKTSKISYLSFTFNLNEKKVPLKKYGLETGGYKKRFTGGRLQNVWGGVGNVPRKGEPDKKGVEKIQRKGL